MGPVYGAGTHLHGWRITTGYGGRASAWRADAPTVNGLAKGCQDPWHTRKHDQHPSPPSPGWLGATVYGKFYVSANSPDARVRAADAATSAATTGRNTAVTRTGVRKSESGPHAASHAAGSSIAADAAHLCGPVASPDADDDACPRTTERVGRHELDQRHSASRWR